MSLFITFEGPEGSGKTTQIAQLTAWLEEQGYDVLATREPGGTAIGDRVRALLLDVAHHEMHATTEVLLFSAARAQHVNQVIRPHLARDGVVLCDRYADSTLAYQGYGRQLDLPTLRLITTFATGNLWPDLTIYLDLPVELGLQRKRAGTGDSWNRMEQQELEFHARVRAGYLEMAQAEPLRWLVIDAARSIAETGATIVQRMRALLPGASVRSTQESMRIPSGGA